MPGQLHFGASRGAGGGILTHAWCDSAHVPITGYPEALDCVEIGFFEC
jgi:hypothetical protein